MTGVAGRAVIEPDVSTTHGPAPANRPSVHGIQVTARIAGAGSSEGTATRGGVPGALAPLDKSL